MADSQTNININIDTSQALANLKALQSQISAFQTSMARGSATQAANAAKLRQNLINDINATKKFAAGIENIKTTTESFTTALEKNKLSMGEYFRYAGGATKNFGKLFKSEMSTIDKVARERVKTLQTQYIQLGRDASGAMKAIAVRPLVLDMEDLGTKTAIAAQKQQILNQLLKQGSTNLLNWGKNTQWAGRQLMVGFTVPLTMAGTAAAKMYMELEKASIKFKRVYGDFNTTAKETDNMVKSLQILAQEYTKYGVAVADTMEMAAEAAAAGKTGADLMQQVANATRLSVLGAVEQSQALETTMSLTNAFGLAAEDLSGKINFLNAVENQTVTSIEDLTIAIPKAAPVIKQLGGDVEDLAFFLTAMKEGGINASEGANALKSGIASMINPTAKASEFLQGFGINLKGIVEANKGDIKGTIVQFAQALNTLDPLNRAQAIEQLFGKFQFARLSTLFQNVTKEGTQAQRVLELSNATTEELAILSERELKRVESSPMFKFQKAVEDIKVKLVPIGEAFLKAITPVIDFVGKFLDGFNKMSDGAKSFWVTFTGLVAGLGPLLLMTVGLIGNGVANLIKMFVGIKSFINRTTQETGMLGESTSYMTETQLRAAAVAASLDQIHQQLTQRFTSEAAAVDALTAAYGRNITAQNAYGPAGTMQSSVGKKYANGGIISGPGTGTSDSIVAMVSNGEAIIPAKSVAQNPDLVRGLIAGNVPKFSIGGIMGAWNRKDWSGEKEYQHTHVSGEIEKTAEVIKILDNGILPGFSKLSPLLADAVSILGDFTAYKSTDLNQAAKKMGQHAGKDFSDPQQFLQEWQKNDREGFINLAQRSMAAGELPNTPGVMQSVEELDVLVGQRVAESLSDPNIDKSIEGWLDQLIADVTQTIIQEFATSGEESRQQVAQAFAGRANTPVTHRLDRLGERINPKTGEPFGKAKNFLEYAMEEGLATSKETGNGIDVYSSEVPGLKIGRTTSGGVLRGTSASQNAYAKYISGGSHTTGIRNAKTSIDGMTVPAPQATAQYLTPKTNGAEDQTEYNNGKESVATPANDSFIVSQDQAKRNSPHRDAFSLGAEDQNEYNRGAKSVPPPAPGKIPGVDAPFAPPAEPKLGLMQRAKIKLGSAAAGIAANAAGSRYLGPAGGKLAGAVASAGAEKLLTAASVGVEKLKGKIAQVGDKLVDRWNQSIDDEIAAKNKVHAARVDLAERMLMASDDEYIAINQQKENLQQKLHSTNYLTKEEQALLGQHMQTLGEKRTALVSEIAQNGTESEVVQERLRIAQQRNNAIAAEEVGNLQEADNNKKRKGLSDAIGSMGGKLSGMLMTASMVTGALSMAGGDVGKFAQTLMPVISGLTMLQMVLQNITNNYAKAGLMIAASVAMVVYGVIQFKESVTRGIDKVLEFNDAIGTGAKAIQGLAEFAGKVSASEIMDKRRQESLNPFQVVSGKTTFGENFAKSEAGDSLIKAAGSASSILGAGGTKSALAGQLATAVLSNAVTAQQARSIAINIGRKMGNVELGIQIAGELSTLLGPNGENVLKDGLTIRTKLIQESQNQIGMTASNMAQYGGMTGSEIGSGALSAAGYGVGGAVAGTLLAASLIATVPVVGWIAAGVMAIGAGIYGWTQGTQAWGERLGQLAAANVAIQSNAINQQKQLLDSLELDYEKRIAAAKAAGDTAKADQLQNQYIQERQTLLGENVKTMTQILTAFEQSAYKSDLLSGMEKAIGKKYKDTAMEDIAAGALGGIKTIGDEKKRYALELLLNTTVDPMAMLFLTDLMATDESVIDKAINISTNLTGTALNEVLGISSMFVDENGKPNTTLQTNFIARMSTITDGETSENLMELYRELGRMKDNWINVPVLVDFVSKNPTLETKIMQDIDEIKDLPKGKLSVDIVQNAKIMNPEEMAILRDDVEYFNSIDTREGQQIYLQYVSTLSGTITDNDPGFRAWLGAEGKQYAGQGSYAQTKYIEWLAQRATKTRIGDNAFVAAENTPTNTGSGPSASWLDDYVKGVRDLTDASQKLTIGYAASSKALEAFAKKGSSFKNAFQGLSTNLYAGGISQDIIDNILGMPKEEADKWMNLFFDKNGKITQLLKNLNATAAITRINRAYESGLQSTRTIYDRVDATKALALGNTNAAMTSEMLADSEMTLALAGIKLIGSTKDQKTAVDKLVKSKLANLAADRVAKGNVQNQIDDAQVRIDTLEAENNIYQNGLDIIGKRAEKIAEAYDKQIQALQDVKSINDEIAKQKQGELDIADALSRGDIGAAAKAAQQLRAQNAQAAADAQMKALEDSKKRAIEALTVEINGQRFNRAELEQKMYDIQLQVLEIRKEEIVQNELILAKQRETLNTLIAQTAEQIKKNAEASKPLTQVTNRVIKTTYSGGGGPGTTGDTKPDTTANPDPTYQTSFKDIGKSAFVNQRGVGKIEGLLSEMDKGDATNAYKGLMTNFDNASQALTDFAYRNQLDADVFSAKGGSQIKDLDLRTKWKALYDKYVAAEEKGLKYGFLMKDKQGYATYNTGDRSAGQQAFSTEYMETRRNDILSSLSPEVKSRIDWLKNSKTAYDADFAVFKTAYSKIATALESVNVDPYTEGIPVAKTNKGIYDKFVKAIGGEKVLTEELAKLKKPSSTLLFGVNKANEYRDDLIRAGYTKDAIEKIYPGSGSIMDKTTFPFDGTGQMAAYRLKRYASGGMVMPRRFVEGGYAIGTDTVPAMLTPGEFVVSQPAVKNFGTDNLKAINNGTYGGNSVYNYSVSVNVANTGANPNDIAQTVIAQIKQIDSQRIRSNNL